MKITSGTTDQVFYFVADDGASTRKTGLSSFTVYRARNGAAAVLMTTPTIAEISASNLPGVYSLLLNEDMTIGAGNVSEEMVFHISAAGMSDVTRAIDLVAVPLAATDIADAVLDRTNGIETGWTLRQALKIILAFAGGKVAGAASTSVTVRDINDTKNRIAATVDADGNRTAITLDKT